MVQSQPSIHSVPLRWTVGILGLLLSMAVAIPVSAADEVVFRYGFLERSVDLNDLEDYVVTGRASPELQGYLRLLPLEQRQQIRSTLQEKLTLSPVAIAQLLYSPLGEELLVQIGDIIQTGSRRSNNYALRSALILAAGDSDGLTALTIIRHYPSSSLRVDLTKGLNILKNFQELIHQTQTVLDAVRYQANVEAVADHLAVPMMQPLTELGPLRWVEIPWTMTDQSLRRLQLTGHARTLKATFYLPTRSPNQSNQSNQAVPVVVISHGLGADRYSYHYLGRHLASHGFAVLALEHPGSSNEHLLSFPAGHTTAYTAAQEFLDRPLDVTFILDQLHQFPAQLQPWLGQLDLERVAVIGQSFGGYTALTLAGAKLDFDHLHQVCPANIATTLNISLILQCQATTLPHRDYHLSDRRVQAVLAVNPITSAVFSPASLATIETPVMMMAGSADAIAPPVSEQVYPFTWLTNGDRYLVLVDYATHFSTIGESLPNTATMPIPRALIGSTPRSRAYLMAMSLAFLRTHLLDQEQDRAFLTAAAAQALSHADQPMSLSQDLSQPILDGPPISAFPSLPYPINSVER